ncbi:SRPBCC family protein [Streptomyces sp. 796.1]|uniref:SRPBCC family protein n=1 Tax=Streptomyces sp. 796.1 TaxID=3163029 RepID=UPI0039C99959
MSESNAAQAPLLQARASVLVSATPSEVYSVISDLPRSGDWSPECVGGTWIAGEPATVGAVFRGDNERSPDVVAWAPVVRGRWSTESEVVAADPGQTFRWAMRDSKGARQESVWGFDLESTADGCVLTHHFWMGSATEGIRGITAEMDDAERTRFFTEWQAKLGGDLASTLERIKTVIEKS